MATLTLTNDVPNTIDYVTIIANGTVDYAGSSVSSTFASIKFVSGGNNYFLDVTGTGLPADLTTFLFFGPTGTITSFSFRQNSTVWSSASGFSVAMADLVALINGGIVPDTFGNLFFGGNDTMTGGTTNNILFGFNGNDSLAGGLGNDTLDGGDGLDAIDLSGASAGVVIGLAKVTAQNLGTLGVDTLLNFERVIGSNFADNITGGTGNDTLDGGGGHDSLNGGAGNDIHVGGEGNDIFRASTGADSFDGGIGTDVIDYRTASSIRMFLDGSGTNAAAAAGDSFSGIENILGAIGNDLIVGDGQANRLAGQNGNDTVIGRAGNDQLEGEGGHDRLVGGTGNDVLLGGAGNDVFVFDESLATGGFDRTTDFNAADDQIEIDASAFGGGLTVGGVVQFVAGAAPSAAGFVGGVFLYNTGNGFLSFDADGGGAGAAVAFFRLQNLPPGFGAADFTVVA